MNRISVILFFIPLVLLLSCSTGPDFERENEHDPAGNNFKPEIKNDNITINKSKDVIIKWKDASDYEDGYIVSKAFGNTTSFAVLDTLPPNTTSYTDKSKEFDLTTNYRIQSYSNQYSETDLKKVIYTLNFGKISSIQSDVKGSTLSLKWDNSSVIADKFLIEKYSEGSWGTLDSVDYSIYEYSYEDTDQAFKTELRVIPLLHNYLNKYVRLNYGISTELDYNLPSNLDVEVTSEATIKIYWTDNTPFDEEFVVLQRNGGLQFGEFNTDFIPIDTITQSGSEIFLKYSSEGYYEFTIQPYLPNKIGKTISPVKATIFSTPPTIVGLISTSKNQVTIKWEDQNNLGEGARFPTYKFYTEISVNEGPFETYSTLENSISEITLSDLDTFSNYKFRIRSYSSPYKELTFAYAPTLITEREFTINQNYPEDLIVSRDGNFFLSTTGHANGDDGIIFYNSLDGSIIKEFSFNNFWSFALSPNSEFLALNIDEKISVFDITGNSPVLLNEFDIFAPKILKFKSNDTLIIYDDESGMTLLDINTGSTELITTIINLAIEENFISETNENLFWSYGNSIYNYNFSSDILESFELINPTITDINSKDELLIRTKYSFLLINSQGEVINEFKKPDSFGRNDEFIKGIFLDEDYIIITGSGGYIHLYNKLSGNYESSYRFFLNEYYSDVREAAWSKQTKKIMAIMRDGNARILTIDELWTIMEISE